MKILVELGSPLRTKANLSRKAEQAAGEVGTPLPVCTTKARVAPSMSAEAEAYSPVKALRRNEIFN